MKQILSLGALGAVLFAGAAYAEQPGRHGQKPPHAAMILKAADANADDVVTRAEFDQLQQETFAWMDRNGDQILDINDRSPAERRLRSGRDPEERSGWDRMARPGPKADSDDNGQVSWEEFNAQHSARFEEVDLNSDGRLTPEEVREAAPKREGRQRRGPRGR